MRYRFPEFKSEELKKNISYISFWTRYTRIHTYSNKLKLHSNLARLSFVMFLWGEEGWFVAELVACKLIRQHILFLIISCFLLNNLGKKPTRFDRFNQLISKEHGQIFDTSLTCLQYFLPLTTRNYYFLSII